MPSHRLSCLLLLLSTLALTSYTAQPSITLDLATEQPTTYLVDDFTVDGSHVNIQPEFPHEGYLFVPMPQVTFSTAHNFQTNNFKYNQIHIGKKFHYYQTDKQIFMARVNEQGLKLANFVDISIPDIIYSQQQCTHVAFDSQELYSVSTCKDTSDNTIYLVMVSYISSKPYYVQSLKTSIKEVAQMKLVGKFLYVLDNDKLHVYRMNLGSASTSKQAMEIVGFIDHAPFEVSKVDISSFDVAVFSSVQKIFMADKSFGLRTIDLNTEKSILHNAFSSPMSHSLVGIAVHRCDNINSCYLVTSLEDSSMAYANWGRNGNFSSLEFISFFSLPKHITITEKLTLKGDFLTVLSQSEQGNRLHMFNIPTGKFVRSISPIGSVDYKPVSTYKNDFIVHCDGQQDGSCKLFVPNPINHLEEYVLKPKFGVQVQGSNFKSTYLNIYTHTDTTIQTIKINKPGQETQATQQTENVQDNQNAGVFTNPFGIEVKPTTLPYYAMAQYVKQQYGARNPIKMAKSTQGSDNNTDDSTSTTTFHTWFIIFLIILAGLAGIAYYTNKAEKPPVVANPVIHDAPSVLEEPLIRPTVIESQYEAPVVENNYKMMQEEQEDERNNFLRAKDVFDNEEQQHQVGVQVEDD